MDTKLGKVEQQFIQSLRKWKREMSFITNQLWMVMGILGLSGERVNYLIFPLEEVGIEDEHLHHFY